MAGGKHEIRSSSKFISLLYVFSILFHLVPALTFLVVCCLRLRLKLSESGVMWVFTTALGDLVMFAIVYKYAQMCYKYEHVKTTGAYLWRFMFYTMQIVQYTWNIYGSCHYNRWALTYEPVHYVYLLCMILTWCFLPLFSACQITCAIMCDYQVSAYEDLLAKGELPYNGLEPTCCCANDACNASNASMYSIALAQNRKRFNNSCCCDGCCDSCIDCAVDCCGENMKELPPNIRKCDIMTVDANHHIVYYPNYSSQINTIPEDDIPVAQAVEQVPVVVMQVPNPVPVVVPNPAPVVVPNPAPMTMVPSQSGIAYSATQPLITPSESTMYSIPQEAYQPYPYNYNAGPNQYNPVQYPMPMNGNMQPTVSQPAPPMNPLYSSQGYAN